jgi:hypothetical protein
MTDTYRALCAELVRCWDAFTELRSHTCWDDPPSTDSVDDAVEKIRTALAQPEAEGPTDEAADLPPAQETAPERIWLYLNGANEWLPFKYEDDVVWSSDQIDKSDIPYVRADLARARPALAQPEPEGPTDEDLLGLDELRDAWNAQADASNSWDELGMDEIIWFAQQQALARWGRPTMAQPEAEGPTDDEVLKLAKHHSIAYTLNGSVIHPLQEGTDIREQLLAFAHDLRARWGRPAPAPIPVAERLPRPEDCNEDCMLWLYTPDIIDPEVGSWTWAHVDWVTDRDTDVTHWLPHWAMPLPTGTEEA